MPVPVRLRFVVDRSHFQSLADRFASEYGLLGMFHHRYSAPVLPELEVHVARPRPCSNAGACGSWSPRGSAWSRSLGRPLPADEG